MEENPFVFGKAAEGSFFTNRKKDAEHLEANLTHGINTILISPRRWGVNNNNRIYQIIIR